nr:hypothetical protein [uncultured Methanoregula sp.]
MDSRYIQILAIALIAGLFLGFILGASVMPKPDASKIAPQPGSDPGQNISPMPRIPTDIISFLFVQEAVSGSLIPGKNGTMTLTLKGLRDDTVYFSDRPARVSGVIGTDLFTRCSMFSGNEPPNAALMLPDAPATNDTVIITISDPQYDKANATLTYTAVKVPDYHGEGLKVYETFADPGVAETFGRAMLFIDNSDLPVNIIAKSDNPAAQDILVFK